MRLSSQQIFRDLKPYQVVADLGHPIREQEGCFYTPSPMDSARELRITEEGFVGSDLRCGFLAGNLFDYLAAVLGSYAAAVSYVIKTYAELAQNPTADPLQNHHEYLTAELHKQRDILRTVWGLRKNWQQTDYSIDVATRWLNHREINRERVEHLLFVSRGRELSALFKTDTTDWSDNDILLIYPYYADYHTVAKLRIQNMSRASTLQTLQLRRTRHSFFGLYSNLSGNTLTRFYPSPIDALKRLSDRAELVNAWGGYASVDLDPEAPSPGLLLDKGAAVSDQQDLAVFARLRGVCRQFFVSSESASSLLSPELTQPWEQYVLSVFHSFVQADRSYSPRVAKLVQSVKSDVAVCKALTQAAKIQKVSPGFLKAMRSQMDTREVFLSGPFQILSVETGYSARRVGADVETSFTNFQLRIDHVVWFEETTEMFYSGRVLVGEGEYPIFFHRNLAYKPRELEDMATTAVRRFSQMENPPLPMITDTTYQKHLYAVISQQASSRPQHVGIRRLGWNRPRTTFTAPAWRATITGVAPTSLIAYPGVSVFERAFSFAAPEPLTEGAISSTVRSLICLYAALLARSYRKNPVPLVRLLETPSLRKLLEAVSRPFGQTNPIDIQLRRRGPLTASVDTDFLDGFPVMVSSPSEEAFSNDGQPLIVISASGASFDEELDETALGHVSACSQNLLQKFLVGLLRDRGRAYTLEQGTDVLDLIREGRRALEHYCQLEAFPIADSAFPLLHQFLGGVTLAEVPRYFYFDMAAQSVFMDIPGDYPGRLDLLVELQEGEVASIEQDLLCLRPEWAQRFLSDFYGSAVTLYHRPGAARSPETPAAVTRQIVTH